MKRPLIPALLALLTSCATAPPHIAQIQTQDNWLVLYLATDRQPNCGSIAISADRITYTIACPQGGKANLARDSVRLNWQPNELIATSARNQQTLFRIACSPAQFSQITAWQHATPTQTALSTDKP